MSPAKLGNPLKERRTYDDEVNMENTPVSSQIQYSASFFQFIDAKYDHTSRWLFIMLSA